MQDLNGLKPERLDAVEDPLAGSQQYRRDVQRELVDDPGNEGLAHSRGAARDIYAALPGPLARSCVSGVEAAGDEVEGRPAFHLDRLVSVMGEHKHGRVGRRPGGPPTPARPLPPPAAPVLIPLAADRPEHVPPHDVRAARAHEPAGRGRVGVVGALVAEMPAMELAPTLAEWILAALVGPSDETVERYRHVAGRVRHRRPLGGGWRLASGDSTLISGVVLSGSAKPRQPAPARPDLRHAQGESDDKDQRQQRKRGGDVIGERATGEARIPVVAVLL